jgi:murein DD-endopeptidase MepM/ murein hydrolase activator NlpD
VKDSRQTAEASASHSSPNGRRRWVVVPAVVALVFGSAGAGAWLQAYFSKPDTLMTVDAASLTYDRAVQDSGLLRANLHQLSAKMGELQARVIEMDTVSKRVAQAAGVATATDEGAGTDDIGLVLDEPAGFALPYDSAETLGRELDLLEQRLAMQRNNFAMLDLVMTQRAGQEASLPTYAPVNVPYLSSSFGWRRHPISGRRSMHEGLDFSAPQGTPIHAASGGVVAVASYQSGYGKTIEIEHGNGLMTRYAHASTIEVKVGDLVEKGQLIGHVGSTGRSTGPHLHFEVRMAGHPLDPRLFLDKPDAAKTLVARAQNDDQTSRAQVR